MAIAVCIGHTFVAAQDAGVYVGDVLEVQRKEIYDTRAA